MLALEFPIWKLTSWLFKMNYNIYCKDLLINLTVDLLFKMNYNTPILFGSIRQTQSFFCLHLSGSNVGVLSVYMESLLCRVYHVSFNVTHPHLPASVITRLSKLLLLESTEFQNGQARREFESVSDFSSVEIFVSFVWSASCIKAFILHQWKQE